jgi:hypothetical protein
MPTVRNIAVAAAMGAALLASGHAFAQDETSGQSGGQPAEKKVYNATGDLPAPYDGNPLSGDQLSKEYSNLSPATRAALANQLKSKGVDGLSTMSGGDARKTFDGLPPGVKAQIQAKWDALSDEQRIAIKKMGPAAIKEIAASQMKEMMKQSVSPVVKPVQQIVEKAQTAVQKAQSVMQQGREYVQGLIAKLKSQSSQPETAGQ